MRAEEVPFKGWESVMTTWPEGPDADLSALVAAIKLSPIIAWPRRSLPDWATVRRSGDVDAYVLVWIASHVRDKVSRAALQ
jgi:hypothetical protein